MEHLRHKLYAHGVAVWQRVTDEEPNSPINIVANCNSGLFTVEECEQNAKLFAAAPDLLEALQNLENDDGERMPATAWTMVQDAIAKATKP